MTRRRSPLRRVARARTSRVDPTVAEQDGARALNPILARLKRACLLNKDADVAKARALAREILNDWDAITAFVAKSETCLPTNNDAETALRHAVIARRIQLGTRTDEARVMRPSSASSKHAADENSMRGATSQTPSLLLGRAGLLATLPAAT